MPVRGNPRGCPHRRCAGAARPRPRYAAGGPGARPCGPGRPRRGAGTRYARLPGDGLRRPGGVAVDDRQLHRVMARAQESGVRAGIDDAVVGDRTRQREARRHGARPGERRDHRTDEGEVVAATVVRGEGPGGAERPAAQRVVDGSVMLGAAVGHRPHDRELVGVGRQPRQPVAERDARHVRGDRPVRAANPLRGIGLEVPEVLAGRAAPEEEEDARPRLTSGAGPGRGGPLHAQ